jgi:glycosyl transferase family 25
MYSEGMVNEVIRDHFDKVFVLSMARSVKRRAVVMKQASDLGLSNAEVIPAVDGRTLDLDLMRSQGTLHRGNHLKCDLTAGEVGCYLSHVSAWKTLLERKLETALICEDDIVWRPDANTIVDHFMAEVPADWDVIYLYSNAQVGSGKLNDPGRKQLSTYVWQGYNECGGAVCYAITNRGARFLMDNAFPIKHAVDGVTNWLTGWWKECQGYRGYICWPFPCNVANVHSEIDTIAQRPEL